MRIITKAFELIASIPNYAMIFLASIIIAGLLCRKIKRRT